MFPIYIGINRESIAGALSVTCVPYIHRDKPLKFIKPTSRGVVFPIYIGINPILFVPTFPLLRVPYIHRDKPRGYHGSKPVFICSLYTQG